VHVTCAQNELIHAASDDNMCKLFVQLRPCRNPCEISIRRNDDPEIFSVPEICFCIALILLARRNGTLIPTLNELAEVWKTVNDSANPLTFAWNLAQEASMKIIFINVYRPCRSAKLILPGTERDVRYKIKGCKPCRLSLLVSKVRPSSILRFTELIESTRSDRHFAWHRAESVETF